LCFRETASATGKLTSTELRSQEKSSCCGNAEKFNKMLVGKKVEKRLDLSGKDAVIVIVNMVFLD
jgi:hypothetical protein